MGGGKSAECERGELLMADYLVTDTELTSVADEIRTKGGTSAPLAFPAEFVSAIAAISGGGGGGLEYEEGSYTPSANETTTTINFANAHTTEPMLVLLFDTNSSTIPAKNSRFAFIIANWYGAYGDSFMTAAGQCYGVAFSLLAANAITWQYAEPIFYLTGGSSAAYMDYWLTPSHFFVGGSSTHFLTGGRTYKWVAVWK